jgi:replication factor A1
LTLVDRSNSSIRLTLWGKQAETYEDDKSNPVIAFKGVRVGEFQGKARFLFGSRLRLMFPRHVGRSLSMVSSSIMAINPDIPDAHVLRGWYDSVGINESFTAYSNIGSGSGAATFNRAEVRTIEDIKANLHIAEKAEMFSCRGTILHIRGENPAYPACPNQSCKKKVIEVGESWHCEKCDKTWEKPEYRYVA